MRRATLQDFRYRVQILLFQSTLSVRRATSSSLRDKESSWISIHALREESDCHIQHHQVLLQISIHALREESDPPPSKRITPLIFISIHALREESDPSLLISTAVPEWFQSTLSVRRATSRGYFRAYGTWFQSTLSVRRATLFICVVCKTANGFQSTLSVRRATILRFIKAIN